MSHGTTTGEQRGEPRAGAAWPEEIYRVLREFDVAQFAYVPDAGHKVLIDLSLADPAVHSVPLTTEEEGVGLLAGAHLGGGRGVLLMQSSGVGNCINFLSLAKGGQFPFLMLVTMRGDFGEGNPWQIPMGQAVAPVLEAMGVICIRRRRLSRCGRSGPCRRHDGVSVGTGRRGPPHPEAHRRQAILTSHRERNPRDLGQHPRIHPRPQ